MQQCKKKKHANYIVKYSVINDKVKIKDPTKTYIALKLLGKSSFVIIKFLGRHFKLPSKI